MTIIMCITAAINKMSCCVYKCNWRLVYVFYSDWPLNHNGGGNVKLVYWPACTKPGKWAVMYLYVTVSLLPLSAIFVFDFGIIPTVWYFLLQKENKYWDIWIWILHRTTSKTKFSKWWRSFGSDSQTKLTDRGNRNM